MRSEVQDVIIIGAGPAGMIAAYQAAFQGASVLVLEKNEKAGRKLAITGKGRCNVTNIAEEEELRGQILSNPRFLYSALSQFSNRDVMNFIEAQGVPLKVERGGRVFPVSDKAFDIVDALVKACRSEDVKFHFGVEVSRIYQETSSEEGMLWKIETGEKTYEALCVILATGGISYPLTGSTGDGYRFAESQGHSINEPIPGLIPLVTRESWPKDMMGLSLKNVRLELRQGKKVLFGDLGEMLFTHFGVSGPLVLTASSYLAQAMRKRVTAKKPVSDPVTIHIDLKPALTEEMLDKRILRDFEQHSHKQLSGALTGLMPHKMIPVILRLSGIDPEKRVDQITKEERRILLGLLKDLTMEVAGTRPIREAIITTGGVQVGKVNPSTMESKVTPGLFFAGEILDLDALTGGFNLQIAFSTGFAAGKAAALSAMFRD